MKTTCFALALASGISLQAADSPPAFNVAKHGHGSPVILIPGLGSSGAVWDSTVKALEAKHECHVLTLAGFAGQPPITTPLIETVAKELDAYIKDQKLGKPAIIGHSLGGFTTVYMASHYPQEVGPIVVVDSIPFFAGVMPGATAESAKATADAVSSGFEQQSRDEYIANSKQFLSAMITSEADQNKALEWMKASDQHTVAKCFGYLFAADLRPELPKIKSRALVLEAGIMPGAVPENLYTEQYQGLSGVKMVRDPKAHHFIMLDDPEFFFTQVKTFLDQPGAGSK